jgi:sigma54-dependent transcription regulator
VPVSDADLAALLGKDFRERYNDFDLVQLAHVVGTCRASESAAGAGRKLYAVSMKAKKSGSF